MPSNFDGDVTFQSGTATFRGPVVLPANTVGNTQVSATAPLDATKTVHQYQRSLSQPHGTAATDERRVIHVARSAGSIVEFRAGPVVAATGDSTVTVDLLVNGVSVLSSVVTIDNGDAAFTKQAAVLSTAAYAAGDVIEVALDATAGSGTLPQGVFAAATLREAA